MKVFPAEVVDAVVAECGRTEQRRRSLPARSVAYFAMGMALQLRGLVRGRPRVDLGRDRVGTPRGGSGQAGEQGGDLARS